MNTEFFSLSFSRPQLREIYEALLLRTSLEDELRREKGLEAVAPNPLLARLEGLLVVPEAQIERFGEAVEESLWEHAWYTFTDEWAWFRAHQDVEKELDGKETSEEIFHQRVEQKYTADFERYVEEIDMKDTPSKKESRRKTA
ncbi:MAG: hypothetical protein ABIO72_01145 [Patescibacteria group bacterium]